MTGRDGDLSQGEVKLCFAVNQGRRPTGRSGRRLRGGLRDSKESDPTDEGGRSFRPLRSRMFAARATPMRTTSALCPRTYWNERFPSRRRRAPGRANFPIASPRAVVITTTAPSWGRSVSLSDLSATSVRERGRNFSPDKGKSFGLVAFQGEGDVEIREVFLPDDKFSAQMMEGVLHAALQ